MSFNLMSIQIKKLFTSFFWFGLVGISAMLVHFYAVTAIFIPLGIHPLIANVFGFLVAFIVSYYGHSRLTFQTSAKNSSSLKSMLRFFLVATTSFLLNQVIFYLLLTFTQIGIDLSLGITLIVVSGSTYILSKFWAFKMPAND